MKNKKKTKMKTTSTLACFMRTLCRETCEINTYCLPPSRALFLSLSILQPLPLVGFALSQGIYTSHSIPHAFNSLSLSFAHTHSYAIRYALPPPLSLPPVRPRSLPFQLFRSHHSIYAENPSSPPHKPTMSPFVSLASERERERERERELESESEKERGREGARDFPPSCNNASHFFRDIFTWIYRRYYFSRIHAEIGTRFTMAKPIFRKKIFMSLLYLLKPLNSFD